ncbi:MAG: hypothetical protein ACRD3W_20905, partial [Terriglobales bacterium]
SRTDGTERTSGALMLEPFVRSGRNSPAQLTLKSPSQPGTYELISLNAPGWLEPLHLTATVTAAAAEEPLHGTISFAGAPELSGPGTASRSWISLTNTGKTAFPNAVSAKIDPLKALRPPHKNLREIFNAVVQRSGPVQVLAQWLKDGKKIEHPIGFWNLEAPLYPGCTVHVPVTFTTPAAPGTYTLLLTARHETVRATGSSGATDAQSEVLSTASRQVVLP